MLTKNPAREKNDSSRSVFSVLGPGILYAASAVGVSHLIQGTRAGADYGLQLSFIIIRVYGSVATMPPLPVKV